MSHVRFLLVLLLTLISEAHIYCPCCLPSRLPSIPLTPHETALDYGASTKQHDDDDHDLKPTFHAG